RPACQPQVHGHARTSKWRDVSAVGFRRAPRPNWSFRSTTPAGRSLCTLDRRQPAAVPTIAAITWQLIQTPLARTLGADDNFLYVRTRAATQRIRSNRYAR